MEDEAKISKVNSLKILNQWRKIMRLAKAESLKKDIEILSQNHERDVDRKDAILQMLDRFVSLYLRCLCLRLMLSVRCCVGTWRRRRTSTRWRCART